MNENLRIALVGMAAPAVLACIGGVLATLAARSKTASDKTAPAAQTVGVSIGLTIVAGAIALGFVGIAGRWSPGTLNMDARLQASALFLVAISMIKPLFAAFAGPGASASFREVLRHAVPFGVICTGIAIGSGLWSGSAGTLASYTKTLGGTGGLTAGLTLLAAAVWTMAVVGPIARTTLQPRPIVGGVLLTGMSLATGGALLGTGSVTLGQYGFALAAISGGLLAAAVLLRKHPPLDGALPVVGAALCTLMVCGVVFSDTPLWVFAVIGSAPAVGMWAERLFARRSRPAVANIVLIGATALVALVAVAPGMLELVKFLSGDSGTDPYAGYR